MTAKGCPLKTPPSRIACVRCGGRVRWRKVRDTRFEPEWEWALPARCSHCSATPEAGAKSITVVEVA